MKYWKLDNEAVIMLINLDQNTSLWKWLDVVWIRNTFVNQFVIFLQFAYRFNYIAVVPSNNRCDGFSEKLEFI